MHQYTILKGNVSLVPIPRKAKMINAREGNHPPNFYIMVASKLAPPTRHLLHHLTGHIFISKEDGAFYLLDNCWQRRNQDDKLSV